MTGIELIHQLMKLPSEVLKAEVFIDITGGDGYYHSAPIESIQFDGSDGTVSLSGDLNK